MEKKLKKYKVGLDSETYAISFVTEPAISEDFIYMSEDERHKVQVMMDSDERHMVYGAVLVPDKPIYRLSDNGEEYYVEFTKESILKMSQEYLIDYKQHNVTLQHQEEAAEVCLTESWIKESMTMDKSVALGLNPELPIGTWFAGFKINNIDTWERIKAGELKGFSVESMIELESFEFAKNIEEMKIETNETFWDKVKAIVQEALSSEKREEVEETIKEEVELEEQTLTETVTEAPTAQETTVETPIVEEVVEPTTEVKEEVVEAVNEPNPLDEVVNNLKTEIEALRKMNESLQTKLDDMGKQPSAQPINTNATVKSNDSYLNWRSQMAKFI